MPAWGGLRIWRRIARLGHDQRGATAIEYALIAVGISIAVAGTVFALGEELNVSYFERIMEAFRA